MNTRKNRSAILVAFIFLSASTGLFSACSNSRTLADSNTYDGIVTVRGNVPFNAPILETSGSNFYLLVLTDEQKSVLMTPKKYRVTGRLYLADWNGRPFAHLEVSLLESLDS